MTFPRKPWTETELAVLRICMTRLGLGAAYVAPYLPGRSKRSIRERAYRMGLRSYEVREKARAA
jgi:hypothetical protein